MLKFKYGSRPDKFFNKKSLTIGTKVELEHTNNRNIAKQIAKAHLVENKNYYKLLKKCRL